MKRYANAFIDGIPFDQLPLYTGITILFGALGFVFLFVMVEYSGDVEAASDVFGVLVILLWVYIITPLAFGAASVGKEVYNEYYG